MALTSLERVKVRLQIPNSVTSKDELLNELIIEAEAFVESYCQRKFEVNTYTERHIVGHKVFPYNYPIIGVKTLTRDNIANTDVTVRTYAYNDAEYIVHKNYIELCDLKSVDIANKLHWISEENSCVNITYTAGYEVIPSDLQVATTLVVVYFYNLLTAEGKSTEKIGDYSVSYTDLPKNVVKLLNKYKKVSV